MFINTRVSVKLLNKTHVKHTQKHYSTTVLLLTIEKATQLYFVLSIFLLTPGRHACFRCKPERDRDAGLRSGWVSML